MRRYGIFLAAWMAVLAAMFCWINLLGGNTGELTAFWRLWEQPYVSLYYATFSVVPALTFARPIARHFDGWRSAIGRTCWALALAPVYFGLGNAVWFYYNTCTKWGGGLGCSENVDVPYPSWADAGYLALLPCILVALAGMMRTVGVTRRDVGAMLGIFLVIMVPTAWLTWDTTIGGSSYGRGWLYDPEAPGFVSALGEIASGNFENEVFSNVISAIYVLTDVVQLSLAIWLILVSRRLAGGLFRLPIVVMAMALLFQYVADMVFFQRVFAETAYTGDGADALYFVALWTMLATVWAFGRVYVRMSGGNAGAGAAA